MQINKKIIEKYLLDRILSIKFISTEVILKSVFIIKIIIIKEDKIALSFEFSDSLISSMKPSNTIKKITKK